MIVLFYPDNGGDIIGKMVLDGLDYSTYSPPSFFGFKIAKIFTVMLNIVFNDFGLVVGALLSAKENLKFRQTVYAGLIADDLMCSHSKVVITFVDNSPLYHMVGKMCSGITFLAVQNGGRTAHCAGGWPNRLSEPKPDYYLDEYFCFGPSVKELFARYSHHIKKYHFCGSLMLGWFVQHLEKFHLPRDKYDICIISQWYHDERPTMPSVYEAFDLTARYVARYAAEHSLKVCVALRPDPPEAIGMQREYYDCYFKGDCEYIEHAGWESFSSYRAVWSSKVSITLNSTLGLEAFGAGKKVLFMNPFSEDWLNYSSGDGIWSLREASYGAFKKRMDLLLAMDAKEFCKLAQDTMRSTMAWSSDHPAHEVIRSRVLEIVNSAARQEGAEAHIGGVELGGDR